MVNKKKAGRISTELSTYLKFLHQEQKIGIRELWRRYSKFSLGTIHKHATGSIEETVGDEVPSQAGRKRLLSDRDERALIRSLLYHRDNKFPFNSKRLQVSCGLTNVSNRTVRRKLNECGYHYLQARRKGLMSKSDLKWRLKFARAMVKKDDDFWKRDICFYLDGTSWVFKTNPCDQANSSHARIWRKRSEGLKMGCTSKGKKAGYGGKTVNFFVSISYSKGVISCEEYNHLTGQSFTEFVRKEFKAIFNRSNNPKGNLFLQDGDPRQNSKVVKDELARLKYNCFSIPARSPDINPIENLFHLVDLALREDAIKRKIIKETKNEFTDRIRRTLLDFPVNKVDAIIDSMPKRMKLIIQNGGERLKY